MSLAGADLREQESGAERRKMSASPAERLARVLSEPRPEKLQPQPEPEPEPEP